MAANSGMRAPLSPFPAAGTAARAYIAPISIAIATTKALIATSEATS